MFRLIIVFFALCLLQPLHAERTLSIIKPNAVADKHVGEIISIFEKNGLSPIAIKMTQLSQEQAQEFYSVHKERSFFRELTNFMASGPVVAIVLEGENAVAKNRELMGATDPKKAAPGTIRGLFATSITENAVHGSDSVESAESEIDFFFSKKHFVKQNVRRQLQRD